jgi:dihydrofolate reductase
VGQYREEALIALVICDISTSLDGYVTGPNDSRENPFGDGAGMLHDWMFSAATDEDLAILQEMLDGVGAIVMGRKGFDKNEGDGGWGDSGPVGATPCFVVTHNKPTTPHPSVYTFVTDGVVSAIDQAKSAAGDKVVGLHGATVMQQALPLGLVDEIRVHVIPVLLGGGTSLFGRLDSAITLERTQVLVTPARRILDFGWSGKRSRTRPGPQDFRQGRRCASTRSAGRSSRPWRYIGMGYDRQRNAGFAPETMWKVPRKPAGDARRQRREKDLVDSQLGQGGLDGFHRVRVAHGAVSCGTELAESLQLGVEVGLRLGNALLAGLDVGRAGQHVGVDGESAAERVEVVDQMGGWRGWYENPELGRAA